MKNYNPSEVKLKAKHMSHFPSAWKGLERILPAIIKDFNVELDNCLEFGTEFGYSASVFSNFFKQVYTVDLFDDNLRKNRSLDGGYIDNKYVNVQVYLSEYKNVQVFKSDFKDFDMPYHNFYDLAHVDINHDYDPTYNCGEKCILAGTPIVLFHDTESYKTVKRACEDLSEKYGYEFYNFKKYHGLGILVKE